MGSRHDALSAVNPGLILLRLSGFGQTGPYRDQPGFGAVGESMGGMRHVTGFPDRPPVRMNISIGDALAALHGVIGVPSGSRICRTISRARYCGSPTMSAAV